MLNLFGVLILVLISVTGMSIGWLCYTASGLQFALLQLNHVPGLSVRVEGVAGRLAGPLHIQHINIDHERVEIDIEQIDIDLTPAMLMAGLIDINTLTAKQLRIVQKPPLTNKPDQPIYFFPALIRLSIDELLIQRVVYQQPLHEVVDVSTVQGAVELSRNKLQIEKLQVVTNGIQAGGEVVLNSDGVLILRTRLSVAYQLEQGPLLQGDIDAQGAVTGASPEMNFNIHLKQPHDVMLKGLWQFPHSGWSIVGGALADQVLLNPWVAHPSISFSQVNLQFDLDHTGMRYTGRLVIPEWSPLTLRIDTQLQYANQELLLKQLKVSVPEKRMQISATGQINVQQPNKPILDIQSQWTGVQWPLHSRIEQAKFTSRTGQLKITGSQPYQFEASGQVATTQWPESSVSLKGRWFPDQVAIHRYQISALDGTVSGSGSVGLGDSQAWQFELLARALNTSGLSAKWPGRIDIKANGKGQGFNAQAKFDVNVQSLSGMLHKQPLSAHGRLQYDSRQWVADGLDVAWGKDHFTAQGQIGLYNNLRWTLTAPTLEQLHPDFTGDLSIKGALSGQRDEPKIELQAQSARLSYKGWQLQNLKVFSHVDMTDRTGSKIDLTADRIAFKDESLLKVKLTGEGQTSNHQVSAQAVVAMDSLPAGMQFDLELHGAYEDEQWQGAIKKLQIEDAKKVKHLSLIQDANVVLSAYRNELQQLCLNINEGRACADAIWQRDDQSQPGWSINANIQAVPLTITNQSLISGAYLQAQLNAKLQLAATPTMPWRGTADIQMVQAGIHYTSVSGRSEVLPVKMSEAHMVADAKSVQTTGEFRIADQSVATFTAMMDRTKGTKLTDYPLTGVMTVSSSDAKLIPVFIPEVDRAAGTVAVLLQLSGTTEAPQVAGIIRLLQGELDFYRLNLALRSMDLDAQVSSDQINFTAQANAGEGLLNSKGQFEWRNSKPFGSLQLKGERLLVTDLPEYRVLASPDLRFDIDDHQVNVKGEVLIPEARLQPKEIIGAVQASTDAHFKNETMIESKQPGWIINSETRVRLGENIKFDALGLHGRLSGEVMTRLRNSDKAEGSGELNVNDGSYEIYGQKLTIKRGQLIYDNTPLSDPGLNIQAERSIGSTTVGVNVRGLLRAPRFQFYSSPAMSQTQAMSYLLVGKPIDELQTGEAKRVGSASSALALQGGGYLASQIGRRIGLEQVDVETDSKNQSSVVLGKFLSPRLFVSYGISLTQAINTLKMRYTLSDRWAVKSELGAAKSADVEFKIER